MNDDLAYVAKCCFHSSDDHNPIGGWDAGYCSGNSCGCEELSDERATVLEVLNHEYGTALTASDLEYKNDVPREWSHILKLGPYGRNLVIDLTSARDVHGYDDALTTSNYEVLQENWKGYDALCDGGYSNCYSIGLQFDEASPADLVSTVKSLEDYPALDDSRMSELEWEWITEQWSDHGIQDARIKLSELLSHDGKTRFEIELPDGDWFDEMIRADIFGDDSNVPYYESGGGAVYPIDEILSDSATLAKYGSILFALV
ncbi:hypothetical protein HWC80_gp044 [Mycobacterium phage Indlulamithi]|uniref:Uncharacterized protein n=1 Tax=Mycobacterium phage Indlulamithi TaxID=2656582 RepID=A0A649VCZ6_9CAUD|nr:hypothetical protein HWC80_gp044 [Mycobacterium phage Indlulamithi]QGJ90084.1 hypothetical protein PBI_INDLULAMITHI_44 [Mycobacterium phage Indlulamithi]